MVLKPENACMAKYCMSDINNLDHQIAIVQDIKHVLKKIRNLLYSSSMKENSPTKLKYCGKMILWEHGKRPTGTIVHMTYGSITS